MTTFLRLYPDTYLDSVVQLSGTRAMRDAHGVRWAAAAMATPANLETLAAQGFDPEQWRGAGANDLFVAIRGDSDDAVEQAVAAAEGAMFSPRGSEAAQPGAEPSVRTLGDALTRTPDSNVAVISVPGDYAALEAHKALTAGLDVLLFSDNVPVSAEVELKQRAERSGRLVMGPGAGTAMLGGTCLGFANATSPGPVAVVAAAGTGAQEAMSLLDRWGVGVSHVIGLGGRDMSREVGGPMARTALAALAGDRHTEMVLLVSKPPDPDVAREVLSVAADIPVVAALIGLDSGLDLPAGVTQVRTLESGVLAALTTMGRAAPEVAAGLATAVREACEALPARRTLLRGLYSGGTLCYESLVVLPSLLGRVYSNTPIEDGTGLPAPEGSHICLDLGEEEYTRGRPHPMIDPEARIEILRQEGANPDVAVIVLDVVLGYGAHPDPAAELATVCAEVSASGGPRTVVYVLGTDRDPQGFAAQRKAFADAGCVVTETAARAALAAAAIARRTPEIAEVAL